MTPGRSLASPGSVGCQGAGRSLKMNLAPLGLGRCGPRRASQKEPAIGDGSQFWEKTQGKSIRGTAVYRISHIPEEMPATLSGMRGLASAMARLLPPIYSRCKRAVEIFRNRHPVASRV
jgi:hypothetical protein